MNKGIDYYSMVNLVTILLNYYTAKKKKKRIEFSVDDYLYTANQLKLKCLIQGVNIKSSRVKIRWKWDMELKKFLSIRVKF